MECYRVSGGGMGSQLIGVTKESVLLIVHSYTLFLHCKSMSPALNTSYFPVVWLCQETSLPWPLGTASSSRWRPLGSPDTSLSKVEGVGGWSSSTLVRLYVQSE